MVLPFSLVLAWSSPVYSRVGLGFFFFFLVNILPFYL